MRSIAYERGEEMSDFRLPDVGEGLTEAEVLSWHVSVGDTVTVNQVLCEIETAKAAVELPSPFAGVVSALLVAEGEVVAVGTPIISIGGASDKPSGGEISDAEVEQAREVAELEVPGVKREAVLVGYGVETSSSTRRPRRASVPIPSRPVSADVAAKPAAASAGPVLAKPPVRKRARDLGIDLTSVRPTGPGGVVTRADVEAAAGDAANGRSSRATNGSGARESRVFAPLPQRDPADRGEERIEVRGVLRTMADAMVRSAFSAPHVTEWVTVDITESIRLADTLRTMPEFDGTTVGPMLLTMWALTRAAQRYPRINASWDADAGEVVVKNYVNLGVAAATPRGLVVPNIKDADTLSLVQLAQGLSSLVGQARAGRTPPSDMLGGTITITNVGVFGVDGGTPIINPGEAAILALGQAAQRPWVVDGAVVPRTVCELTLSFDHRMVDGELGSRVLADVASTLRDPWPHLAREGIN
jgi:2-oxoisovalerate dehydrogenase E2 component (dihydrolipoyl transacylase)